MQALVGQSRTKNTNRYDQIGPPSSGPLFQVIAPAAAWAPGLNYASTQVLSGRVSADGRVISYTPARSAKLTVEYNHRF